MSLKHPLKGSRTRRLLIAMLGSGVLLTALTVQATNQLYNTWVGTYPNSLTDDNAGCVVCHNTPSGTGGFNPYGSDVFIDGIVGAEGLDSDGDPGGCTNIQEINLSTQPAWTPPLPTSIDPSWIAGDLDPDPSLCGAPVDEPPVADAGPDVSGLVGETLTFDGSGSSDDNGIVSYEWTFGDGASASGETVSHAYTAAGSYTVTLTVTDGADQTDQDMAIADIADVPNIPPTADPGGPYSGTVGIAVDFNGSASDDPDGQIVSYEWNFGDGNSGTGPTPSHIYDTADNYPVTLTVTDNDGASGVAETTASIGLPDNIPPVADAGGSYEGVEGEPVTFDAGGSNDPDGTIDSYTWDFGDGSAVVTVTTTQVDHTYAVSGTYTAELTVSDNNGAEGTDTADVTILEGDPPPVADAGGPYTGTVGVPLQLDGSNSSDSGSGTIVQYDWDYGDGTVEEDAGATPTHTYMAVDVYTVTLTVTDDGGKQDSATADADILPELVPPEADPNGPYFGTVGEDILFDGSASSDADGTIAEWNWDFGDGFTASGETPTHAYGQADTYTVTLTVEDNDGLLSSPVTTTATIGEPDQIPVADPNGPYDGKEGREVTFDGSDSFDPDGGTIVSYDWDFGDGNSGIGPNPTNVYATAGSYDVTLTVTDDEGQVSDSATTSAEIVPDEAPTALTDGPYSVQIDQQPVTFDGSASFDPDGVIVSWEWDFGDNDTGSGEVTTHTYADIGSYDVSLTVTDDFGNTDITMTTATITEEPVIDLPPVADANGPYSALVDEVITFDGSGSTDPNGNDTIVSYEWDFGDGTTGTGVTVEHAYAAPGTYSVSLMVTDDTGLSDSDGTSAAIVDEPTGEADVFLTSMRIPTELALRVGRDFDTRIIVFGDGDTIPQDATVILTAISSTGEVEVEIEPESITSSVIPGNPETRFILNAELECKAAGDHEVEWTAMIDAAENADPSNDILTGSTSVTCMSRGAREARRGR